MSRRLLDLFCGAGGAAMGYHRAGFEVVGVDINPQPHYPFEFHQADALTYPLDGFDVVHASPPCQAWVTMSWTKRPDHPRLIAPTRERLEAWGGLYVIENVPTAPVRPDLILCGTMFGLQVRRHRHFELNFPFTLIWPCYCRGRVASSELIGHRTSGKVAKGRRQPRPRTERERAVACGVEWMSNEESRNAIPPAYTQWIGGCALRCL